MTDDRSGTARSKAVERSLRPVTQETAFVADPILRRMTREQLEKSIANTTNLMKQAAKELDFLQAAQYRDEIIHATRACFWRAKPLKSNHQRIVFKAFSTKSS